MYDLHILQLLAHHLQGVQQSSRNNDRRAVLVIVEHRNIQLFLQATLDLKAFGAADILQIDAAELRGQHFHRADHFLGVLAVQTDGECLHAAEFLKQGALTLHHGQTGGSADVAKAQHSGAVGHHGHHVAFKGIFIHIVGVCGNAAAGLGHAGRIGRGKLFAVFDRRFAHHAHLAVVFFVQFQCCLIEIHCYSLAFLSGHGWLPAGHIFQYILIITNPIVFCTVFRLKNLFFFCAACKSIKISKNLCRFCFFRV